MRTTAMLSPRVTWLEAAIVAAVLAILAALVVPQFSEASADLRTKQLQATVELVRGQIELYRIQHANTYPCLARFVEQMTLATNREGEVALPGTSGFRLGPYLKRIPLNPYTGTNDVGSGPPGSSAWYYDETTGTFRANHKNAE